MLGLQKFNFYHETTKATRLELEAKIDSIKMEIGVLKDRIAQNLVDISNFEKKVSHPEIFSTLRSDQLPLKLLN